MTLAASGLAEAVQQFLSDGGGGGGTANLLPDAPWQMKIRKVLFYGFVSEASNVGNVAFD